MQNQTFFSLVAVIALIANEGGLQAETIKTFESETNPVQNPDLPCNEVDEVCNCASSSGDCPTWMYDTNGSCVCGVDNHHTVKCDQSTCQAYILDSNLMTYDEQHQEVIVGTSLYGIYRQNDDYDIYHLVPMNKSQLNEAVCGQYNRKGRQCGECKEGYSPLVYSYNVHCRLCSETESKQNIVKFIGVVLVPLTLFYLIVLVFKFNANSPKLHGFILYAQLVAAPFAVRVFLTNSYGMSSGIKVIATMYGFWNLDFFRTLYPDMCLKVTTLQALALDYVIAFYPLLLVLVTLFLFKLHSQGWKVIILLWHPLHQCLSYVNKEWSDRSSMIDVFATFLLLSYGRIMSVSFNLLVYSSIVNQRGEYLGQYLYYDASYEFLGAEHLPYGIAALVIFICFNILPLLVLFFYPIKWFQKCLNFLSLSHVTLHTFVDSFAGSYKDGTEPGIRDYRYFAGLNLLIRLLIYITYELTLTNYFFGVSGIITTIVLLLYAIFQPYKSKYAIYNKVTMTMLAIIVMSLLSVSNICVASTKMYQARSFSISTFSIVALLPQLYITTIAMRWTGVCSFIRSNLPVSKLVQWCKKTEDDDPSEESLLVAASRVKNNHSLYDAV